MLLNFEALEEFLVAHQDTVWINYINERDKLEIYGTEMLNILLVSRHNNSTEYRSPSYQTYLSF